MPAGDGRMKDSGGAEESERQQGGGGEAKAKNSEGEEGRAKGSRGAEEKRTERLGWEEEGGDRVEMEAESVADGQGTYIRSHLELDAYQLAFESAMRIFQLTKGFPKEETYSLTDQIRRSSRSVCSNIAEAWRKRRYEAAFISKLNESEAEAAETQTWIAFAVACGYLAEETGREVDLSYSNIIGKIVNMIAKPEPWLLRRRTA